MAEQVARARSSGLKQPTTKIPKLTPRSAKDDQNSSLPRPSKLQTPTPVSALKKNGPPATKSSPETAVQKFGFSTKQHATPRHVISPRTLRPPTKVSLANVKPSGVKPGVIPKKVFPKKMKHMTEKSQSMNGKEDSLFDQINVDDTNVIPLSEQKPPPGFSDYDSQNDSSSDSNQELRNEIPLQQHEENVEDKENAVPKVPPLDLHLLDESNSSNAASRFDENFFVMLDKSKWLEEEKSRLESDMQSLRNQLKEQEPLDLKQSSSSDLTEKLNDRQT